MEDNELELGVYRIQTFKTKILAEALNISEAQARNIKKGSSNISNTAAQFLKNKFGLDPSAFAKIRNDFIKKKKS